MSGLRQRAEAWAAKRPGLDWGLVALAALVVIAFLRFSPGFTGGSGANGFLVLAAILAVGTAIALRYVGTRDVRDWTTLLLTFAVVYAIIASFSLRGGDLAELYLVEVGFIIAVYALLALGLSIQMGYAGLLNFGHVAFMLIGGYTIAIFTTKWGGDIAPALEGANVFSVLMAVVTGLIAGALVYAPVLLLVQRFPLKPRMALAIAAIPSLILAGLIIMSLLPLDERGAMWMVIVMGIILGVMLAALAALFLGAASLRLREDYLAIVTLGTAEILRLAATNEAWLTNGTLGILLRRSRHELPIAEWARESDWFGDWADTFEVRDETLLANAIVAVIVLVLALTLLEALARSPWGRVLRSIREDEEVSSALGKNVLLYKLQALMIGSAIAALAGMLFVWKKTNVYPTDFLPIVTFYTVAILVLGGIGNHKGAVLGAIIIWGIFEMAGGLNTLFITDCRAGDAGFPISLFCNFAGAKQQLLIGLTMILVIMFRPQGAVGNKEELAHAK